MRSLYLLYIFLLIITTGCKGKNDVLATFDGGNITRGELYNKIEEKKLPLKAFRLKKLYQKKELQMMAIDKISILEAKKTTFDKSDRFNFLYDDVKNKYLGAFLVKQIINEKGFNEKTVNVSHIVLKLKDRSKSEEERVLNLSREIINKTNSGESFEKLAEKYSEDISRTKSGKVGYILFDMFPEKYAKTAFSLKPGKISENPIYLKERQRIFIIKVNDIKNLTPDNIEEIIPDKKMRVSYNELIKRKVQSKYLNKLKDKYQAVYNKNSIFSKNKMEIVYTIKNNKFTVADLHERYKKINKITNINISFDSTMKEKISKELFTTELLKEAAMEKNIQNSKEYTAKMRNLHDSYLAGEYMEYINSKNIDISQSEMLKEYNLNKNNKYYSLKNINGDKVKVAKPFNSVKKDIENSIRSMKTIKSKARWIDKILKTYNYKVLESELEGI